MSFGPSGQVGDQDVGVEMGITGAARAVRERRRDQSIAGVGDRAAGTAAYDARVVLEPVQRGDDCLIVGVAHLSTDLGVGEGEHDRHRLGRRERQVEAGCAVGAGSVESGPTIGVEAFEHRVQVLALDRAIETECGRMMSEPDARCFTRAEVVVLTPRCHRVEVVRRAARAEDPDAQHQRAVRYAEVCGSDLNKATVQTLV